jgi:hypothetical protein
LSTPGPHKPAYFAVFGVDTVEGSTRALIPFVAASAFELRQMSSAPNEGFHRFLLPTAKVLPQLTLPDVDDLDRVFTAVAVPRGENRRSRRDPWRRTGDEPKT